MLVAALAASVAIVHLVMGWHSEGPVVFDDEGGYLRIARHLAGEGPLAGTKYFPGYSLLITPIHWALGSTGAIYAGVKVLNALLGAGFVVVTFLATAYLLPRDRRWLRLAATGLVSLYPSYVLFSNQAFSENALVPLSMVLAYGVARLLPERPAWAAAAGLGAVAAYSVVVHPRALGAVAALGLVAALWWSPWRAHTRRLVAGAFGLALVGGVGFALLQWERSGASSSGGTYALDRLVDGRLSPGGVGDMLVGAAGQVLYLVVSTGGLLVVASVEVVGATRSALRDRDRSPRTAMVLYAGLVTLFVLAISGGSISPRPGAEVPRPDAMIYGRYNEGLMAPLLLVGVAALVSGRFRLWDSQRWWRGVAPWLVVSAVGTAAVVEVWQFDSLVRQPIDNPFNVLTLYSVVVAIDGVNPLPLAALGVAGGIAFLALGQRSPPLAVGAGSLAFLFVAAYMGFFHLPRDHYDVREEERVVAETANAIDDRFGIECVGLDRFEAPTYHFQLYLWYVDEAEFAEFSSDHAPPEPPCGPLVVSSRADLDGSYPGARLVAREGRGVDSYLWVLPGDLQAVLESENMLS